MTQEQLENYRQDNMREIDMPDGTTRVIRMTPDLWESLEFLEIWEIMSQIEIAKYALEEMTLQEVSFERAFRGVVAHVANIWAKKS